MTAWKLVYLLTKEMIYIGVGQPWYVFLCKKIDAILMKSSAHVFCSDCESNFCYWNLSGQGFFSHIYQDFLWNPLPYRFSIFSQGP